jgi:hypothetical protein
MTTMTRGRAGPAAAIGVEGSVVGTGRGYRNGARHRADIVPAAVCVTIVDEADTEQDDV